MLKIILGTLTILKKTALTTLMLFAIGSCPWMCFEWGATIADIWSDD